MKKIAILSMIFVVGIMSFIMTACGKAKDVSFTFVNDVAVFNFDDKDYVVGDTATFSVTIDEKYSQSDYTVYANDELLVKGNDGKYSYELSSENVSFEVKDYDINTYTYSFDVSDFELTTIQVGNITHGESFSFYISTIKYEFYVVKVNGVVISPNNGQYVVSNVTSNLNITIEDKELNTYDVTFDVCEGVGILEYEVLLGTTVEYGDSVNFNIQLATGYEKDNFEVKANNVTVPYNNGYTVSNITSNTTIVITGVKKKTYNIIFENTTGITGVTNTTVNHGESYTFTFDIADNYHVTDDFEMLVNGTPVVFIEDPIEFPYQFGQMIITENTTISFSGVELDSYIVLHYVPTGVSITGNDFVTHGDDYTFTVVLSDAYKISSSFDILVNGTSIYQAGVLTYTIDNVTSYIEIEVSGVEIKTCTITFENTTGLLIMGSDEYLTGNIDTVYYDASYTFACELVAGYRFNPEFNVYCNGESIYNGTYSYTLNYITEDITISFIGVGIATYSVDYTLNIPDSCTVVLSSNSVTYGEDYTVTVTAKEGYDISNLVCRVEGYLEHYNVSTNRSDNTWVITVEDVRCDQTVVISGIAEIPDTPSTFSIISFPVGLEYVLAIDGEPYENGVGAELIELTGSETIDIEIIGEAEGYDINYDMFDIIVTGADVECLDECSFYSITNITGNVSIDVLGVYAEDEYILVYEKSDDYTLVIDDEKLVYHEDDYVTFDVDVVGDYEGIEVLVNDVPLTYISNIGYQFQIKGMDNEIVISVIITR